MTSADDGSLETLCPELFLMLSQISSREASWVIKLKTELLITAQPQTSSSHSALRPEHDTILHSLRPETLP